MSWPASPEWLLELQAQLGALLRTPLNRATGTLRAETAAYDARLVAAVRSTGALGASERLAIYHRQYWFRLLTVLQGLYPLTARLLGYWHFNDFAMGHLVEHPPHGFDVDTIGEGFEATLKRALPASGEVAGARGPVETAALLEAAHVDAAFHRVTRAPSNQAFVPTAEDAARLMSSCLVLSNSVALVHEHWPLCERRITFVEHPNDEPITLAARSAAPQSWLLARHGSRVGLRALEPAEAQLLTFLQQHPLDHALALLERAVPEGERAQLPERAQAWLASSVQLGIWAGFASLERPPELR